MVNLCKNCIHWNECNKVGIKVGKDVIAYLACDGYQEFYKDDLDIKQKEK